MPVREYMPSTGPHAAELAFYLRGESEGGLEELLLRALVVEGVAHRAGALSDESEERGHGLAVTPVGHDGSRSSRVILTFDCV